MGGWLTIAGRAADLPSRGWRVAGGDGLHYGGSGRLGRPAAGAPVGDALAASGADRVRLARGPGLVAVLRCREVRLLLADPPSGLDVLAVGADQFCCRERLDRALLRLLAAAAGPAGHAGQPSTPQPSAPVPSTPGRVTSARSSGRFPAS